MVKTPGKTGIFHDDLLGYQRVIQQTIVGSGPHPQDEYSETEDDPSKDWRAQSGAVSVSPYVKWIQMVHLDEKDNDSWEG